MKKRNILICTLLMGAVLTACGEEQESGRGRRPESTAEPTEDAAKDPEPTEADPEGGDSGEKTPADNKIHVDNMEDFIEAIAPGAQIELATGQYNLSDYLGSAWAAEGEAWNDRHDYVEIRDVYDGLELVIKDVDGLELYGGASDPLQTEIVTDPRYASVLNFDDCENVHVMSMTLGHTDRGDCSGDVLYFEDCRDVYVDNADLYGCGVYGIDMDHCEGVLQCHDCKIHDCAYGPLMNWDSEGVWTFTRCELVDSASGGYFQEEDGLQLIFDRCTFGDRETENFMYRSDTKTNDCTWGDPTNYPDYEEPVEYMLPEEFHTDELQVVAFDEYVLEYTFWNAFEITDEDTGETKALDAWLSFEDQGTGMKIDDLDYEYFTYEMDSDYSAKIYMDDSGKEYSVILYSNPNEGDSTMYLQLMDGQNGTWYY